jgi:hypothetical protein
MNWSVHERANIPVKQKDQTGTSGIKVCRLFPTFKPVSDPPASEECYLPLKRPGNYNLES